MKRQLEVVQPRQSNYDTYFIPKEVSDIGKDVPLYRLVSYWGMRKYAYICRDDIAHAFGVSLRQASGLISAIYRKHEEVDCSLKRVKAGKGNVIKSYLLIHDVKEKKRKYRVSLTTPVVPRKVREKQSASKQQSLWIQLLTKLPQPRTEMRQYRKTLLNTALPN